MRTFIVPILALAALMVGCSEPPAPAGTAPSQAGRPVLVVHKSPTCGCCTKWMDHVNASGLATEVVSEQDMNAVQERLGVPPELRSCHVAKAGNYLIVGHVPAADIQRLLAEKPAARGLSVRGMPLGSPGMEHGEHRQPYDTVLFQANGESAVFAHHGGTGN